MVNAEELGLSSATIDGAAGSTDPDVRRFLGKTDDYGAMLGLDAAWAARIVKQVGNYAESYDRSLAPLGVERGLNRLWKDGGVLYVPALR
jgi:general L-amino acid transport system substrate-binding protein